MGDEKEVVVAEVLFLKNHRGGSVMEISVVGIDIAKQNFWIDSRSRTGKVYVSKAARRDNLVDTVSRIALPQSGCVIAMEACGSSNYWGRVFGNLGYKVKLIPPQFVKPFILKQKNDRNDAHGISIAGSREDIRTVPVKPLEQQDIQCVHRVREQIVKARTAQSNELRSLLFEYGVVIPQGHSALSVAMGDEATVAGCSDLLKRMVRELYEDIKRLAQRQAEYDKLIAQIAKENELCALLMSIPGVGPLTATALYASVGHMKFKNGRELAAYIGLVPRQFSSGGKETLGRISKRGNIYLRALLVHGARAVLRTSKKYTDYYSTSANKLLEGKGYTKAAVALANRNARIAWSILSQRERFDKKRYGPHCKPSASIPAPL